MRAFIKFFTTTLLIGVMSCPTWADPGVGCYTDAYCAMEVGIDYCCHSGQCATCEQ